MDVEEQIHPILRGDAPQEHLRGALAIELSVEDSIALGALDQPVGIDNVDGRIPHSRKLRKGALQSFGASDVQMELSFGAFLMFWQTGSELNGGTPPHSEVSIIGSRAASGVP